MNKSFLVTRSCTTSIFIYFSDLAELSNAVRIFFFFSLLKQLRGWGRQKRGSCRNRPGGDLRPARGGAGDRGGRNLRPPFDPRLHLPPHGVDSVSSPCSPAFTHKHHSFPLGRRRRRRRQPEEAGSALRNPVRDLAPPGASASRVTEELCAAPGEAAANSAPRVLGCPGAWDAAAALLSGADSTRCPLRSGGCGQHGHTRSTPLPVAERG